MKKLIWMTDIHLDYQKDSEKWITEHLLPKEGDILFTGDISNGNFLSFHLKQISNICKKKVFFVCGNHDFWHSNVKEIRNQISSPEMQLSGIYWLGNTSYIQLDKTTVLLGHDGWYDVRYGMGTSSKFLMCEPETVSDFHGKSVVYTARNFAADSALHVKRACENAILQGAKRILIATHYPPYEEACFHKGMPTEDEVLPWYSSYIMGETISELAAKNLDVKFEILCGHTHSKCNVSITDNIFVSVGSSALNGSYQEITFNDDLSI